MVSIDRLLARVTKPGRYAGGELNAVYKDPASVAVRFAFAFPDVYEIGMSHLGMKILTDAINRRDDAWCERVFAPWPDMEAAMRTEGVPLFALESRDPIREFDFIGFTLQYELCYTNLLNILDLAGLPLEANGRKDGPIVMAGGPCAANPGPLAEFIDVFVIGDGEEAVHEVIDAYIVCRDRGKAAFLNCAADIPGVYVPSIPRRVTRRVVRDLNAADYPLAPVVPGIEAVHDRVMLEVARGCTRGCRFCQAGFLYRPTRERGVERLLAVAEAQLAATGYDEISLTSLSAGDYSRLPELAAALECRYADERVSVSLPSLRVDAALSDTLQSTASVRLSGLTFAPEAGTQRLRDAINKGVTRENLLQTVREAFSSGYTALKLYFMIGLPTETDGDVLGIAELVRDVVAIWRSIPFAQKPKGLSLTVGAASFVPKPFTPFQWDAQDSIEELTRKQRMLRDALRIRGVTFTWHDPQTSFLEAVFSRGDHGLCRVLAEAYRRGARFDGWSDQFKWDIWAEAFAACGVDPAGYAQRVYAPDEPLPWDFVDIGVRKAFLAAERARADEGRTTPDCRGGCHACGLSALCEGVSPCAS